MKKAKVTELCNECGRSVKFGTGRFVNRVSDFDTLEERKINGRPYPEGDFICPKCDAKYDNEDAWE